MARRLAALVAPLLLVAAAVGGALGAEVRPASRSRL